MLLKVILTNWDKHNPKQSRYRYTWFKLDNDFCTDPELSILNNQEFIALLYIFCNCSKKQRADVIINTEHLLMARGISENELVSCLEKCQQLDIVSSFTFLETSFTDLGETCRRPSQQMPHCSNKKAAPTNKQTNKQTKKDPKGSMSSGDDPPLLAQPLITLWNDHKSATQPKVVGVNKSRLATIRSRLKENPDLEQWKEVIKKLAASDFCNGSNDRGWKANFDFLLRPNTFHRTLEGEFDNHVPKEKTLEERAAEAGYEVV